MLAQEWANYGQGAIGGLLGLQNTNTAKYLLLAWMIHHLITIVLYFLS